MCGDVASRDDPWHREAPDRWINQIDSNDFVRRLRALAEETHTAIYAWALMSNHAHLLLCSGAMGLAKFMRRLLTGYAVRYNVRHRRHGPLFQDRYKSIVCAAITILSSWFVTFT